MVTEATSGGISSSSSGGTIPIPLARKVSDIWELDFYRRPVEGIDGKKLWELIITDTTGTFEHVEVIPNSLVNSRDLRARIEVVISECSVKPTMVRFFRQQMRNMISIALNDIEGISVRPSRRTYALKQLIKYREKFVYPNMPGYKDPGIDIDPRARNSSVGMSKPLPDALRCDTFSFVQQPLDLLENFYETAAGDGYGDYFGERCFVSEEIGGAELIPGLVMYSTARSASIAGWMSGLELAAVSARDNESIMLECGLDRAYKFGEVDKDIRKAARNFEDNKKNVQGVHFLAIMKNEESDDIDGLWLLSDD